MFLKLTPIKAQSNNSNGDENIKNIPIVDELFFNMAQPRITRQMHRPKTAGDLPNR